MTHSTGTPGDPATGRVRAGSLVLALGIPALAVLVGVPFLAGSTRLVLGFPAVFAWLFAWAPLSSLCMWLAWWHYDRHEFGDAPTPPPTEGSGTQGEVADR
ncbi:DUF3311 domain-containing protein [Streptomyces sp. LE64]|uniref:DUF3311 domain-containing protein n=1 Tax=Streptomyces sp. LE64 TaxID=3448653 RepID=UPI0040431D57